MRFRADDDIYRARLVYVGPPGYTLPVQLTYGQWGLFVILAAVFLGGGLALTGGSWKVGGLALAAAVFCTHWVSQHVDPDRPARKVITTVVTDWHRHTPTPAGRLPGLSATNVRIRERV
jgi:hypothetical protein